MLKENKKLLTFLLGAFICLFVFMTIQKPSNTLLDTRKNVYRDGTVYLEDEPKASLETALTTATEGQTVTVEGELTLTGDITVPSGITLSIQGDLTIPTEYTLTNEGIITVETVGTLIVEGTLDLKYASTLDINGDVNVETGSTVKTSASLTETEGQAIVTLYSTGALEGDANAFVGYEKIVFTNFGGTLSSDISDLLEEQAEVYSILDEATSTYYETFVEVPTGTTVKVISSMEFSNDIIPTGVEVIVEDGLLIKVTDTLTINGALRMNESELEAKTIEGSGLLELVPGSYNAPTSSYLIYTTIETLKNTVTLNSKNGTAGLNDVYFKIDKSTYNDAKTVANAVKLGNNLKSFTSYVATKDCDDYATSCEYEYLFKLSHKDVPDGSLYKQILKAYYVETQEQGQPVSTDYTYIMSNADFATIQTIAIDTRSLYDGGNDNDPEPYIVRDFTGIEKLTSVKDIEVTVDGEFVSGIDFTGNTNLEKFTLTASENGKLGTLNFIGLTKLQELYAEDAGLTTVTLSNNTNLETVLLGQNKLTTLTLNGLTKLKTLDVSDNRLTSLNTDSLTNLETLDASNNDLSMLNTSNSQKLKTLDASYNRIDDVDFILNSVIEEIKINNNKLITLDLGDHPTLKKLYLQNNDLIYLDITGATSLEVLHTYGNKLSAIDLSTIVSLKELAFECGEIIGIDFKKYPNLISVTQIGESSNTCATLQNVDLSANTNLVSFQLTSGVKINALTLPASENLETLLLPNAGMTSIDLSGATKLTTLDLSYNELTTLDISANTNLETLNASNNRLTAFKSGTTANKINVDLSHNLLETLDLGSTRFKLLDLSNNELSSVDLQNYVDLEELNLFGNNLEEVKIVGASALTKLNLGSNNLTHDKLNLTGLTALEELDLSNNEFTQLDLSALAGLSKLDITGNNFGSNINKKVGDVVDATTLTNPVRLPFTSTLKEKEVSENLTLSGNTITVSEGGIGTVTLTYQYTDDESTKEYTVEYTVKAPKVTTSKYTINEEEGYVYIGSDKIDSVEANMTVVGGVGSVNNATGNYEVRYTEEDTDPVLTYKIIAFSLTDIEVVKNSIILTEGLTWKDIKDALVGTDLTIKLYKYEESEEPGTEPLEARQPEGETPGTGVDPTTNPGTGTTSERVEVTEDTTELEKGMEVDVFIGADKVDTFKITDDFITTEGLTIDEGRNLIVGLSKGTTVEEVENMISTSGIITWYDKEDNLIEDITGLIIKTGQTVKIELTTEIIEYTISIKGDVNGDGGTSISDVMKTVSHILESDIMTKECYLQAANVNNDEYISISDVMMLVDITLQ